MRIKTDKIKRSFKAMAAITAAVVLILTGINAFVILSTKSAVKDYEQFDGHYDYIIVLGCGIIDNSIPTDLMADRLDMAIRLYEDGTAPMILLSGDHRVDDYNEVAVMRNYLLERGIPDDVILCDDLGLSTNETMERAVRLYGVRSAVIVTQKYHLYRSVYLARDYGVECEGVIATGHTFIRQPYYSARECLARVKDFILCLVN